MKKSLLTIGMLGLALSASAQAVLTSVDTGASLFVGKGALLYNGGGAQTKGTGQVQVRGNVMVVGDNNDDALRTVAADGSTPLTTGNNIILYNNATIDGTAAQSATYGQLYITGISQDRITSVVDKQYAAADNGDYQHMALPFYGKSFGSLAQDFGITLNEQRWSKGNVIKWSNANIRFDGSIIPPKQIVYASTPGIALSLSSQTTLADRTNFYAVGGSWDASQLRSASGVPFADGLTGNGAVTLTQNQIDFGVGGNNRNIYREKYNTYIFDPFETTPWTPTYGKNIYQFGNPYLTNLDLSNIGINDGTTVGDNNLISNLVGVVSYPTNVKYNASTGTTSSYDTEQKATFSDGHLVGNVNAVIIRPAGTFKIKLSDSTAATLDFDRLRRFAYKYRSENIDYSVNAAKKSGKLSDGTIKQLGVIFLDENNTEVGETYYVVSPKFKTGYQQNYPTSVQATAAINTAGHTYEEDPVNGGIDQNQQSNYRLYINEVNENNFLGKKVTLGLFDDRIKKVRFELRENTGLLDSGVSQFTSGKSFYYTAANGQPVEIHQGDVVDVAVGSYGLYYDIPSNAQLATSENSATINNSRTLVLYSPMIDDFVVRFDPNWKKASVELYDISGKLVKSFKDVQTADDLSLGVDRALKTGYIVKITSDQGIRVNTKIVNK